MTAASLDPVRSALCGEDAVRFLEHHFTRSGKTLYIGNIGFSVDTPYVASILARHAHIDFQFFTERRPDVPRAIGQLADLREREIRQALGSRLQITPVQICAEDNAPVAGRNACAIVSQWLSTEDYTDVVLDATGLSRGTCFPVCRQLVEYGRRRSKRIHLVVADSSANRELGIESLSGDRGDWIHGFQGMAGIDGMADALRLWIVQLQEDAGPILNELFKGLEMPGEVCPIVPFPSVRPGRGDQLLFELRERWLDDWGESPLSLIYAHESDPTDVFRSIASLHETRHDALSEARVRSITILSPLGRRLPSIGMLLAALHYDLPMFYLETVGYRATSVSLPNTPSKPDHLWCFRMVHP